jgi:hypothetical protein
VYAKERTAVESAKSLILKYEVKADQPENGRGAEKQLFVDWRY